MSEKSQEELQQEYLKVLQEQVMAILNGIKEETGIDTPIEVEIREVEDDE